MKEYHDHDEQAIVIKLERQRMRAGLIRDEEGKEDFFAFQARCVAKFGMAAGIYVRQLVFWEGKQKDPNGWIYKSEDELGRETGLRRRNQREARKVLTGLEVLEEKRAGLPRRLFYRVDLEKLAAVLETPHSTMNQWKRGMIKDPETGRFHRPEDPTLNLDYRQDGNTDPASKDGNTDLTSEDGNTVPASEVGSRDLASKDGIIDPASEVGTTVRAITESTARENARESSEGTSEISSREASLQEGANGFSSRPTPPPEDMNSSNQKEQEREPGGSTSSPRGGDDEPKIISEIRGVLDSGKHTSVAAQHYRAGATDAETVAEYVSQDLYRNIDGAAKLLPFVRIALGESEIAS